MSQQFNRAIRLRLENSDEALDLSEMHVTFEIHQALTGVPNWAVVRVYNLSPATERKAQDEFTHLDLAVGYGGDVTRLFYGQVRQFNAGLQVDAKSTYIDFICQAGDYVYNWAAVSKTLAAGWTYADALAVVADEFKKNGIKRGHTGALPVLRFPRAKVMYGAARDHMDRISENISADWTIVDDEVRVVPFGSTLPNEAVVVTADTGLIGLPQQTVDGITLRMLINPNVTDGGILKLDNQSIQTASVDVSYGALNYLPRFDADGLYKVYSIDHRGDTRGREWYSDVICVGLNENTPISDTYTTAVPNRLNATNLERVRQGDDPGDDNNG